MKVNVLGLIALTMGLVDKMNDNASIVNAASLAGAHWPETKADVLAFLSRANFDNVAQVCADLSVDDVRGYFSQKRF